MDTGDAVTSRARVNAPQGFAEQAKIDAVFSHLSDGARQQFRSELLEAVPEDLDAVVGAWYRSMRFAHRASQEFGKAAVESGQDEPSLPWEAFEAKLRNCWADHDAGRGH